MRNFSINSLMFWKKTYSKEISRVPFSVETKHTSFAEKLDFDHHRDFGAIPSYVKFDPDFDDSIRKKSSISSKFYQHLIQEGPNVPGNYENIETDQITSWIDLNQIKIGVKFLQTYTYSIFFSNIVSIFLLVSVRPLQALLMRTTPFHNTHAEDGKPSPSLLFTLKVLLKLRRIYEEINSSCADNFKNGNEIQEIRDLLKSAAENFKKFLPPLSTDLSLTNKEALQFMNLRNKIDESCHMSDDELRSVEKIRTTLNPVVPLSQYDLAILQFAFFGLPVMFPRTFGMRSWKQKEVEGFIHIWALIGYMLGLKDEFNTALLFKSENPILWNLAAQDIYTQIFRFSFSQADAVLFKLWTIFTRNLEQIWLGSVMLVNIHCLLHFVTLSIFAISPVRLPCMSKFNYYYHRLLIWLTHCWIFRLVLNSMLKFILWLANWYFIQRQVEKHKNIPNGDISSSRISLTRTIKWSNKEGGIVFDVV